MIVLGLLAGLLSGRAAAAPHLVVDHPLTRAPPCADPAPAPIVEALRAGIPLRWRRAVVLFPDIGLERALVRRVVLRAARVGSCGGRVIAEDVTARLVGPRGAPIETVIATTLRPGPVLGVTEDDVAVRPPPGSVRVTARDAFTAYGAWDLGGVRPAASGASPSSRASAPPSEASPEPPSSAGSM